MSDGEKYSLENNQGDNNDADNDNFDVPDYDDKGLLSDGITNFTEDECNTNTGWTEITSSGNKKCVFVCKLKFNEMKFAFRKTSN